MRVNSYNKFFAEVAKIMNTEVKSVKQLDGRYKVELSNVFRGVGGSLFIHDHRGIAHTTSCYDFDDFKTMKDLYYRLITEYCESTNNDIKGHTYVDTDSVKVAPLPEQQTSEESITDTIIADDNSSYNIEVLRAKQDLNTKYGNSYRKHLHAIINPEWHNVNLATLANIDNDMLDEKRQRYFKIYKELIKTVSDLHKCKTAATYQIRWWKFKQVIADDIYYRGTTLYMTRFLDAKISMCNVECGLRASANEKATSFIKSRRYRQTTLK